MSPFLQGAVHHSILGGTALELNNLLRMLWEEHIAWTRMFIISVSEGLADLEPVTVRLLRNPAAMAAAFRIFYGDRVAVEFENLLKDHLTIAARLVKAAKAGDATAAGEAEAGWYANADAIVAFLNRINPYWPQEAMRRMWHEHLRLTKAEAVARLNKDYAADIALYDEIEKQALGMADSLTEGIVEQFPEAFPAGG